MPRANTNAPLLNSKQSLRSYDRSRARGSFHSCVRPSVRVWFRSSRSCAPAACHLTASVLCEGRDQVESLTPTDSLEVETAAIKSCGTKVIVWTEAPYDCACTEIAHGQSQV